MAKLGYTWYPKDWGNSDAVFELTLIERGLYRELIDMAMLSDNKTQINVKTWARKFGSSIDEIDSILITLVDLELIKIDKKHLFIPSCEARLKLVRGGKKGGENKPTISPNASPSVSPSVSLSVSPSVSTLLSKEKRKEKEKEKEINTLSLDECNLIVSEINSRFKKNCKQLTPNERYHFNERLKEGYVFNDFINTIKNLENDDYAKERKYSYCIPNYIAELKTLQQFSSVQNKKLSNEDIAAQNILKQVALAESFNNSRK